jgi:DNA polymerase-3 subunit gamma/tau
MSYQVLARKWRPRRFADLVGQTHVARALINALDHDRLHHAFLFTGTRGVGKTTIARILAKSLNCEAGVSSQPCGECSTCREVDEGRFVDLIEVDAASRTKVDDTRELLDNVQYAPTRGRYKVYLIDEVHMLSGHSFNALLKTLEEPPPHVKFLLATTDPQKLPVTVLSRCLQFHLKRLPPELIAGQLEKILTAESLEFDAGSLVLLAQAADGSMRDALSLLDQAIAFGGGRVHEPEVREMLGSIDDNLVDRALAALAGSDGAALLAVAADAHERNADPEGLLAQLLRALHRIAVLQTVPNASVEREDVLRPLAAQLSAEDVQLCYQIGLVGQRDLPLAPDARTGLEMTLLRMLAFQPAAPGATPPRDRETTVRAPAAARPAAPAMAREPTPPTSPVAAAPAEPAPAADTGGPAWNTLVGQLGLVGLVRELAFNCALDAVEGQAWQLTLDPACANLLGKERETALQQALTGQLGHAVQLRITVGNPRTETPAREAARLRGERQQAAETAILNDPNVQALQQAFNARVNPTTVRPKG